MCKKSVFLKGLGYSRTLHWLLPALVFGLFVLGCPSNSSISKVNDIFSPLRLILYGGDTIASQQVAKGEKAKQPDSPKRGTDVFDGWYDDQGEGKIFDFDTSIDHDYVITAHWHALDSVDVTKYTVTLVRSIFLQYLSISNI